MMSGRPGRSSKGYLVDKVGLLAAELWLLAGSKVNQLLMTTVGLVWSGRTSHGRRSRVLTLETPTQRQASC
jgi:hypothetical protein